MKYLKYFLAILLTLSVPALQYNKAEASTSQIQMTIKPLMCNIDIVHDGINHQTHYSSQACQRALGESNIPTAAL